MPIVLAIAVLLAAAASPGKTITWTEGDSPPTPLRAESLIATPTGFSVLSGPDPAGGAVWSTANGERWLTRTLPRVSIRIVYHRTGLFVVDGRQVIRVGPDGDDPTVRIAIPDPVRVGSGSKRSGLVGALDGLLLQTTKGDLFWSEDGRSFQLAVPASRWGADSDVTPRPPDVRTVAPARVASRCDPRSRRAPDVPLIAETRDTVVAFVPESDPVVVWPACEPIPWRSVDGTGWVALTASSPFPPGAHLFDVAWRSGRFVAVGGVGYDGARAWTSLDGKKWREVPALTPPPGVDLTDVEAGGIGWVVTGTPHDGSARIGWYSRDGSCWERIPAGVVGTGFAVGDDRILMIGAQSAVWLGFPSGTLNPFRSCS